MDATHRYITVLLEETVSTLASWEDGCYLNGTSGRGSHSRALLEKLGTGGRLLGFDEDPQAIQTGEALAVEDGRFVIVQRSPAELGDKVCARGLEGRVGDVLLDLGVSSPQLGDPECGLSSLDDGPLGVRMNPGQGISAVEFIADTTEEEIARVFEEYGEECSAKRMARAIVQRRRERPLERTIDLAEVIMVTNPIWEKGKNLATRVFQGLRIHINNELGDLKRGLDAVFESLIVGGHLVVISSHSLEDCIAKPFMRKHVKGEADNLSRDLPIRSKVFEPHLKLLGKPQYASEEKLKASPRLRSAVVRVAEKLR